MVSPSEVPFMGGGQICSDAQVMCSATGGPLPFLSSFCSSEARSKMALPTHVLIVTALICTVQKAAAGAEKKCFCRDYVKRRIDVVT